MDISQPWAWSKGSSVAAIEIFSFAELEIDAFSILYHCSLIKQCNRICSENSTILQDNLGNLAWLLEVLGLGFAYAFNRRYQSWIHVKLARLTDSMQTSYNFSFYLEAYF